MSGREGAGFATLAAAVCLECQDETAERGEVPIRLTLPSAHALGGKRTYQGTALGAVCRRCGLVTHDGPDAAHFERSVALRLTKLGLSTGAEIAFVRKRAGLTQDELGRRRDARAEAVRGWEQGAALPPATTCALVAHIARPLLERLDVEGGAHGPRSVHLV